jgi:putative DNA methylase
MQIFVETLLFQNPAFTIQENTMATSDYPVKSPRKLIEVALPLDAINVACAREKSIRHGHPSTLHLWWARRPLAAARAVIFAQMVNDPGYQQGGGFKYGRNKKDAAIERKRLFDIIEELVKWENTTNEEVLERARAEIRRSWREVCELNKDHPQAAELFNPDKLPALHDPFAGGGSIPLEAQRLGLEAYASDLNPVAVLINKAMIEIPPKFAGRPPVSLMHSREGTKLKGLDLEREWPGATGLAEDVRYYGAWMREEAQKRIGHLYPPVEITEEMAKERPDLEPLVGQKLTVIAWLWARTVKSPNPAFSHVDVPLASTFVLSSKAGKEAYVEPIINCDHYQFTVKIGTPPPKAKDGTKIARGANFRCVLSDVALEPKYIKAEGKAGRMGAKLMAVVVEGVCSRVYIAPTQAMEMIAVEAKPTWKPEMPLPADMRSHWTPPYGLTTYGHLFTPRQLVALTTFSDLVQEAREKIYQDALVVQASSLQDPPSFIDPRTTPFVEMRSRGELPHLVKPGGTYFVTFRLADAIEPKTSQPDPLAQPLEQVAQASECRLKLGGCALAKPEVAAMMAKTLQHFHGQRYYLHSWCVMPNHVHAVVTPLAEHTLSSILHSWKSFSANQANALLNTKGAFWERESFDHLCRTAESVGYFGEYVEQNPVAAGLCSRPGDWVYSSAGMQAGSLHHNHLKEQSSSQQQNPLVVKASSLQHGSEDQNQADGQTETMHNNSTPLEQGGIGAQAYAEAVSVYLAFGIAKCSDYWNSLCTWAPHGEYMGHLFTRQAIPMAWDFAEANPFSTASGNWSGMLVWVARFLDNCKSNANAFSSQKDAQNQTESNHKVVSTDPPYYDNIGYADLSDFLYVWHRTSLKNIFPDLFSTISVPKKDELVATPYRHGTKENAERFFLNGMSQAMVQLSTHSHTAFPITIYYAFKQSDTDNDDATSNTGWITFLEAVLNSGFSLIGTWPMRTEMGNRMVGMGTNALASSIVLVCRKRSKDASSTSRREFVKELNNILPEALENMTKGSGDDRSPVAPVDLSQAIIGPGMAVFSKYSAVLEADGSPMSVRTALQLINRFLAESDFDADTGFCLSWFEQHGWNEAGFGEADTLARARGTSVDGVRAAGVITAAAGKVRLLKWADYDSDWNPASDDRLPVWEVLHRLIRALRTSSETRAGQILAAVAHKGEPTRQLAYRLYTLCERNGWAEDARAYNELVTSWEAIEAAASQVTPSKQGKLF